MSHHAVLYREVQRPRLIWWLPVVVVTVFVWYSFIQQIIFDNPVGDKPAPDGMLIVFWIIFGIVFPFAMTCVVRFVVEVRKDGLYVRFRPFHVRYRAFPFQEIQQYKAITYNSLKRFGGWGIRINLEGEKLYNLNGNEGLELILQNNQTVVIGSQNAEDLTKAIDSLVNIVPSEHI